MDKCTILVIVAVGVVGFWFGYAVDWGIWVGAAMVAFSLGYFCVTYCKKRGLCDRDKRQSQTSGEESSTDTQTTKDTSTSKDIEACCDEEPANLDPLYYHPSADPEYDDVTLEEVNHISIGDVSIPTLGTSVSSIDTIDTQEIPIAKDKVKRDQCVPLRKAIEVEEGPRKTYTDPLHFHPKAKGNKTPDKGVSNQTTSEESTALDKVLDMLENSYADIDPYFERYLEQLDHPGISDWREIEEGHASNAIIHSIQHSTHSTLRNFQRVIVQLSLLHRGRAQID